MIDFEVGALDAWLRLQLGHGREPLDVQRTEGGMSNPTYFLQRGDWQAVLRKQPAGPVMPSAHAIDREWRVLGALQGSAVPVPRPLHWCDDRGVVGTPFYLMQRLHGRVFHPYALPGVSAEDRAAMYDDMVGTLAALHRLDPAALGLADYGRPGNYFARQLKRWSDQWAAFRRGDDDNPALDRVVAWLRDRAPDSELQALCHGDFRLSNLVFHPTEPRVIGVLDWELSTLGHPLVDLAYNTQAWRMADDENGGLRGQPLPVLGIPAEHDYLERYYRLAGSSERLTPFHQVFAMFRGAVGSAGVARRGEQGNGFLPDAAVVGHKLARAYAAGAVSIIEATAGGGR